MRKIIKAIVMKIPGKPSVLKLEDISCSTTKNPTEVLIKIKAGSRRSISSSQTLVISH